MKLLAMKINEYLKIVGLMLLLMGVFSYDLTDYSFDLNKRSLLKMTIGILLLVIYFVRKKYVKAEERHNN